MLFAQPAAGRAKIGWEQSPEADRGEPASPALRGRQRGEQEGESPTFRVGKGQVFPACEPDRVTAEAVE